MRAQDFRCYHRLTVRDAEVDGQKIVYNAHYLTYVDAAVAQYLREMALPDRSSSFNAIWRVKKSAITYIAPAHAGDVLDVGLRCTPVNSIELHFDATVFRDVQKLANVALMYSAAEVQGMQVPPQALCECIAAFEAGEPMVRLHSGSWNDLGRLAERLRLQVFVEEQGVPREMEMDEFDPICRHVVATNRVGQPVATGRLLSHAPSVARIGRMAVARELRGGKIGRQVLDALIAAARDRGDREVILHAQLPAQNFYARAGFSAEGEVFEEAGIAHVTMRKNF